VSQTSTPSERCLVVFPGALGDFVCFLPALAALQRRTRGAVTVVCQRSLLDLARIAGVAEALPLEGIISAWLFMEEPPPAAHGFFSQFSAVEAFTGSNDLNLRMNLARWGFSVPHPFRSNDRVHAAVHWLRELGEPSDRVVESRISPPDDWTSHRPHGGAIGMNNDRSLVVHPGSGGQAKRWSRSGFRAVCNRWAQRFEQPLLLLGPAEGGEVEEWRSPNMRVVYCDTLRELVARLAGARAYLGNDSGVTHLAAALGLRGVALFGPSDEHRWRPLGEAISVLRLEPWRGADEDVSPSSIFEIGRALTAAMQVQLP